MKIFNFFKKTPLKNIQEEVTFSDLEKWIKKKEEENKKQENIIISEIEYNIKYFTNELETKIINLEKFNIDSKKEEERVKQIVNNNRKIYVELLRKLIKEINCLKKDEFTKIIEKINDIFYNFGKKSFKSYERATYLIGKEMLSIKESLKSFSNKIIEIFDKNKYIINFSRNILKIKEKTNLINSITKNLNKIKVDIFDLSMEISEKEKEKENLKDNIKKIKINPIYLENLERKKNIEILKKELEKDIYELKQLIDFKMLTSFFHSDPKKKEIVKNYKEHFYTNLKKGNEEILNELLSEAKLNNDTILKHIRQVNIKRMRIKVDENKVDENKVDEIFHKINKIDIEIGNKEQDKHKEEKRYEKLNINKKELINILKNNLEKLDVKMI